MSDITTSTSPRPAVTNDDGTGRTGTRWNEAFNDAWTDSVNEQVASATNPTLTPADIIDEVVEARAAYPDLDARLDDLALASSVSTLVSATQLMGGLGGVNLVRNDDFLVWPDGDAAAPWAWTLTGAAATVARTGTGLGDTSRKVGDFACKLTRAGTNCYIQNSLLAGAGFSRADFLQGKYLAFGMWVKCSTPNIARIAVNDGIGTGNSSYHTGGGTWEFLAVTRQLDASATQAVIRGIVDTADGNAIFSGATVLLLDANFALAQYQPSPVLYGAMHFALGGNLSVASNQGRVVLARGGIVKDIQMLVKTAPTGQAAIFDVNTWDGASYTTMCTTKPTIADGALRGGVQPDGTYARRCLRGGFGTAALAGTEITLDTDQVGSGVAGADVVVEVRILQYASPLERFAVYSD